MKTHAFLFLTAACLSLTVGVAHAEFIQVPSKAPLDIKPSGQTPYYGRGTLGVIEISPRNAGTSLNERTGMGEGSFGSAPVETTSRYTQDNFTFINPQGGDVATGPRSDYQIGYDDQQASPNNERWEQATSFSLSPPMNDGAYFSGFDAVPQQGETYYAVITNNSDWQQFWREDLGREPPGQLQQGQAAVAAVMEPRSYSGYALRIGVMSESANSIQTVVTQLMPAPSSMQVRNDNTPYAVMVVRANGRAVQVLQNRRLDNSIAPAYNNAAPMVWDPVAFYTGPNNGDTDDVLVVDNSTADVAPASPRSVPVVR